MEPAPNTTQRSPATFRFSSSPSSENPYFRHLENMPGEVKHLHRAVRTEQSQKYLDKATIRQFYESPSRSDPLDHFEAACSQLRRAWTALGPLSRLDDLSSTFGSLFEVLEPEKRLEVLSVLFSKALENLVPEDIPQALQHSFNEMNCQITDPRYHAVFKSPPPPLNEWNELFNRMENDPKVQEAKKTKKSGLKGIIKNNPFTERVMDEMRKVLIGATYDKIRENISNLKGDNPLVKLIKATKMTGEVSPCILLNAVNRANYSRYIVNFESLLDEPIQSQEGGFDIEPRTVYRRSDRTTHSWSSKESDRLSRSSSIRGSTTSIDTVGSSVTNETRTKTHAHHQARRLTNEDSIWSQRSLLDTDTVSQPNTKQHSEYLNTRYSAPSGLSPRHGSFHDTPPSTIRSEPLSSRSRENNFGAPVTRKDSDDLQHQAQPSLNHSRQPPPSGHTAEFNVYSSLTSSPAKASHSPEKPYHHSTSAPNSSSKATSSPSHVPGYAGNTGQHCYQTQSFLSKMPPLPSKLTDPLSPEDHHETVLHELETVLNEPHPRTFTGGSNMASSYGAANRTDTGNSLESSKQQTTAYTPKHSSPKPRVPIRSDKTSLSTTKSDTTFSHFATADSLSIRQNQYSAHHQAEPMNNGPKKKTAEEACPSPNQMNTLKSGRIPGLAGESSKERPP